MSHVKIWRVVTKQGQMSMLWGESISVCSKGSQLSSMSRDERMKGMVVGDEVQPEARGEKTLVPTA